VLINSTAVPPALRFSIVASVEAERNLAQDSVQRAITCSEDILSGPKNPLAPALGGILGLEQITSPSVTVSKIDLTVV
jgi:hypothetical protein